VLVSKVRSGMVRSTKVSTGPARQSSSGWLSLGGLRFGEPCDGSTGKACFAGWGKPKRVIGAVGQYRPCELRLREACRAVVRRGSNGSAVPGGAGFREPG
jgi:hypothetical protein